MIRVHVMHASEHQWSTGTCGLCLRCGTGRNTSSEHMVRGRTALDAAYERLVGTPLPAPPAGTHAHGWRDAPIRDATTRPQVVRSSSAPPVKAGPATSATSGETRRLRRNSLQMSPAKCTSSSARDEMTLVHRGDVNVGAKQRFYSGQMQWLKLVGFRRMMTSHGIEISCRRGHRPRRAVLPPFGIFRL
eukprot:4257016-Amphidinium_carterae.1